MMSEPQTNMSKDEIFKSLLNLKSDCQECKNFHLKNRLIPHCKECHCGFWINEFSRYLGINENNL